MKHGIKTLLRATAVAALALPMTASGVAADETADEAAIRELWNTYETVVVESDAQGWLALWDSEGIQMPPNRPMRSYDVLVEEEADWSDEVTDTMTILPIEIVVMGDYAYSMGIYSVDYQMGDGKQGHVDGKFMTILHRQDDGSWKLFRDIFNSNVE